MIRGWRKGLVIALGLGLVGSAPLMFAYASGYEIDRVYRSLVALWVNAIAIGYVIGLPMFQRLAADVERLAPLMEPPERSRARSALSDAWSNPGVWVARILGVVYGLIPSTPEVLDAITGRRQSLLYLWVPLLIPILWAIVLPALWRLIRLSVFVYRLGRDSVRIDLGDLRSLGAFADIGIRHLLIIVVGLSVIPMQAILTGSLELIDFVPPLIVTAPVALIVLILPMWGIHRAVAAAKARELDRLTTSLSQMERDGERFLLLSMYRRQIADVPEWPVSAGSASRVLFYVVIPPLAWVAAALVQNLVSNVLGLR